MQRFKSPDQAQRFLSAQAFIYGHFHPRRHQMPAAFYCAIRCEAFTVISGTRRCVSNTPRDMLSIAFLRLVPTDRSQSDNAIDYTHRGDPVELLLVLYHVRSCDDGSMGQQQYRKACPGVPTYFDVAPRPPL